MTFVYIWFASLIAKICLLPHLPITPDETYYFVWGRHPQLSYFDHPPFVSWIMILAQPFWKTSFGIRLPGVILGHLSLIPWFFILKNCGFTKKTISFWLIAMLLAPLTGLGGFITTPDLPLTLFWGLSLFAAQKAIQNPSPRNWLLLGLFFGLGMLSKYTMVLFLPALFFWILLENKGPLLKSIWPWVGLLLSFIVFSPVILWNIQHHFASFKFQMNHGLPSSELHWKWPLEYILGQIGLLNPIIFVFSFLSIKLFYSKQKMLTVFSLTPLLFFFFTSFKARVEPNWPLCAYPALTAMALYYFSAKKPSLHPWLLVNYFISAVFFAVILSHSIYPWLPIKPERDHTKILHLWKNDIPVLEPYHPLFARSYQLSAFYSYFRTKDHEVLKPPGLDRVDFYDFLSKPDQFSQGYIVLDADDFMPEWFNKKYERKILRSLPSGLVLYQIEPK